LTVSAQQMTNLIADQIEITPDGLLVASGSVTVWQGDTQIIATKISYSNTRRSLNITGPISLTNGSGTVILADQAAVSEDLSQGIIKSARVILNQQVQITTAQISLANSRYTQAYKVAATSCFICRGKTPLWQIRAKRIVHDRLEKQLHFDRAQLRIMDVPVFFFPYLRLPDPSLNRASGFLVPQLTTSTTLGAAIRTPYFFKLGNDKDITLTPILSSRTNTLGFRYRQAFQTGRLSLEGAVSRDTLSTDQNRGYLLGVASYELNNDYKLGIQIQAVSDPSYFFEYDVNKIDRLESNIRVNRTKRYENSELRFSNYHSLRASDSNSTQPTLVTEGIYQQRMVPGSIGGVLDLESSFLASYRYSGVDTDGSDTDLYVDGYDTARLSFVANWQRDWSYQNGVVLDVGSQVETSQYVVRQHAEVDPNITRISTAAAVGLRWPLSRRLKDGGLQRIEPRIQLVGMNSQSEKIPNQDSTRVEFDEGNLYNFNRSPGLDQIETGTRINIGVSGSNHYKTNTKIGWEIGRVYREDGFEKFSKASGLSGFVSDWLVVSSIETPSGIELVARALLKNLGNIQKAEARMAWENSIHKIAATYVGLSADTKEDRATSLSSLALNWQYGFAPNWQSVSDFQFNATNGKLSKLNLGLKYANECLNVSLSASRHFSTSTTLKNKTEFGLSVELSGFSSGVRKTPKIRLCGTP
ncbi:MAG: LPS assembly protein LptD, partial [Planktomarina sp.]|nr:LPS assembly protein LptD [Planktomarina sp.]